MAFSAKSEKLKRQYTNLFISGSQQSYLNRRTNLIGYILSSGYKSASHFNVSGNIVRKSGKRVVLLQLFAWSSFNRSYLKEFKSREYGKRS